MENAKISIIIPVYNTEEFVKDAVLSIMNQTIREIEILVINDGSTDDSWQEVQKLAETDKRIKLFSHENIGLARTRNVGLTKASGKYIYFMDSDDILEPEALNQCFEKCENENLDFVFFDADVFGDEKWTSSFFDYHRSNLVEDRTYNGIELLDFLLEKEIYRSPVWLYLVRHDFLKSHNLTFYPVRHEDQLFTAFLHICSNQVGYLPKTFFKRRLRSNSVMTSNYSTEDIDAYLTTIDQLVRKTTKSSAQVIKKLIRYTINPALYNARTLPFAERIRVFAFCSGKSYLKFLSLKNLIVFLFPFTVTLKSYFKRIKK